MVDVGPDGKQRAFALQWPGNVSRAFFLSLKLADASGQVVSDDFY